MSHSFTTILVLLIAALPCEILAADPPASKPSFLYVATYSPQPGEGLFVANWDAKRGDVRALRATGNLQTTAALVIHPRGSWLYATTLMPDAKGQPSGAIAAFSVDATNGDLKEIDRHASGGTGPCYLAIDSTGGCLVVANCGNASVACLQLNPDGRFGDSTTIMQHTGTSQNSEGKPQAHSILVAPGNRFAIAADLGLDRVFSYQLDVASARMTTNQPPFSSVPRGAGPRHVAFHPTVRWAYSVNELNNTVSAFSFDSKTGTLESTQNITTLPDGDRSESYAAEIQVHPTGRFLYASNRGHDSVARYAVDPQTGQLRHLGHTLTGGKFPRHFTIDPAGQFLIVANQKSHQLVHFQIDRDTGDLRHHGLPITVPQPVCVKILARPQ